MSMPAPIDLSFVPYTKRPMLRRNAGLFVDARRGRGRGAKSRVVPQTPECAGRPNGTPCGNDPDMFCCFGECKFGGC